MPTTWLKLETNIPIVGTCRAAYFMASKKEGWSDQIGLYGEWTKQGPDNGHEMVEGAVGVSAKLETGLRELGVITGPHDADNKYPMGDRVPIKLLKREKGKQKWTEVTFLDGSGPERPKPNGKPQEHAPAETNPWLPWQLLEKEYGLCLKMAHRQWMSLIDGIEDQEAGLAMTPDPQTLQAAAATILIQAERRGLRIPQ